MSKAILVVDMPENCADCQFGEIIEWGKIMCNIEHRSLPMVSYRPHWCPLIPEPKRINIKPTDDVIARIAYEGWNCCLDALEGDNETN